MQSPLHVESPLQAQSYAVISSGCPVDRGPFPWDRTKDGALDATLCLECGQEGAGKAGWCSKCKLQRVKTGRKYSPANDVMLNWVRSRPSGFEFQKATVIVNCGLPSTQVGKYRFVDLMQRLMAKGEVKRVGIGIYRRA